jgi:serine/threonine protein kinase
VDMWAMGVITFIILAGYPPFSDEGGHMRLMFDKIKKAQYTFDAEYWSHISPEAKSFIQGMLTLDPNRRLTAADALQHPWVRILFAIPFFIHVNIFMADAQVEKSSQDCRSLRKFGTPQEV